MASPLDRMIDEACGLKPGAFVTMQCPTCQKEKQAPRHETDPEGTAVVEADCPGVPAPATKIIRSGISARTGRSSVSKAKPRRPTAPEVLYGATEW